MMRKLNKKLQGIIVKCNPLVNRFKDSATTTATTTTLHVSTTCSTRTTRSVTTSACVTTTSAVTSSAASAAAIMGDKSGDVQYDGFALGPEEIQDQSGDLHLSGDDMALDVEPQSAEANEFMAKTIENMQACLQCLVEIKDGNDERLQNLEATMEEMVQEHRTEMQGLRSKIEGFERDIQEMEECNKKREERFRTAFNETKEQIEEQEDRMKGILLVISESIYNQEEQLKKEAAAVAGTTDEEQDETEKERIVMAVQRGEYQAEWKRKELQAEMQQELLQKRQDQMLEKEQKQKSPTPLPSKQQEQEEEQQQKQQPSSPPRFTPEQQREQQQQLLLLEQRLLEQEKQEQQQQEEQQRKQQQLLRQQLQLHLLQQRQKNQEEEEKQQQEKEKQEKQKQEQEIQTKEEDKQTKEAEKAEDTKERTDEQEKENADDSKDGDFLDLPLPMQWLMDEEGNDFLQVAEYVNGQVVKTTPRKFAEIAFHSDEDEEESKEKAKEVVEKPVVKVDLNSRRETTTLKYDEEPIYATVHTPEKPHSPNHVGENGFSYAPTKPEKKIPPPIKEKPKLSKIPVIRPPSVLYDKSLSQDEQKKLESPPCPPPRGALYDKSLSREEQKKQESPPIIPIVRKTVESSESTPDVPPRNPVVHPERTPDRPAKYSPTVSAIESNKTEEEESVEKEENESKVSIMDDIMEALSVKKLISKAECITAASSASNSPYTMSPKRVEEDTTLPNTDTDTDNLPQETSSISTSQPKLGISTDTLASIEELLQRSERKGFPEIVKVPEHERNSHGAYPYRGEFVIRSEDRSAYRKMRKKTMC